MVPLMVDLFDQELELGDLVAATTVCKHRVKIRLGFVTGQTKSGKLQLTVQDHRGRLSNITLQLNRVVRMHPNTVVTDGLATLRAIFLYEQRAETGN